MDGLLQASERRTMQDVFTLEFEEGMKQYLEVPANGQ